MVTAPEARQSARAFLLVEDDLRLAVSLQRIIEARGAAQTHVAASAAEALNAVSRRAFDLAIVDLGLPDVPGAELIARLTSMTPPLPALALTIFDGREQVLAAARAGAAGYLLKEEPLDRLLLHIDEVLDGRTPVSSRVARFLFEACRGPAVDDALTLREHDVLGCLSRGLTYGECAKALGLGLGTIQTHVKAIYRKLDVSSKAEAAAWAVRRGRS